VNLFVAGFIGSPTMNFLDAHVVGEKSSLFVRGDNFKLAIPDVLQNRFLLAKDRDVILGIRPEHLYDMEMKGSFTSGEILRVIVEVVEPIGSESILITSLGSAQLTARVDPRSNARPRRVLELLTDMNRIHLFDKQTERSY
jgi:multiple sugar transport system ATP-binding protein